MKKNVLAFDFGASSGRAIVGKYADGEIELEEVHRFSNYPTAENGTLYWNYDKLFQQVLLGIKKASARYSIASLGIDTWGVDFGLLDAQGQLLSKPVSYRDTRTKGILQVAEKYHTLKTIYQKTGNQLMEINTLFQLLAVKEQQPELLAEARTLLFMPDLLNYHLTGITAAEKSIASTSQLLNAATKSWDAGVLEAFGFAEELFPPLVTAGNLLGTTKESLGVGSLAVYNVCEHDTASAVVSVPSNQANLFISCGTWSLVGTELAAPVINEQAFEANLTNEIGINDTTRFLKNCTGLWLIQEVSRNLATAGRSYTFAEIAALVQQTPAFKTLIDTDHPDFTAPGEMIQRIKTYAQKTQQPIPQTDGELFRCIYESLAMKYQQTFLEISDAVGQEFQTVSIVGGGSRSTVLCQMVADASKLVVYAGPVEATALGNISLQLLAQGVFRNVAEVRQWINQHYEIEQYHPSQAVADWATAFERYQKIIRMGEKLNVKENS